MNTDTRKTWMNVQGIMLSEIRLQTAWFHLYNISEYRLVVDKTTRVHEAEVGGCDYKSVAWDSCDDETLLYLNYGGGYTSDKIL